MTDEQKVEIQKETSKIDITITGSTSKPFVCPSDPSELNLCESCT